MFSLSLIIAEISLGCLQNICMVRSIVVERNQHAYYKLPANFETHLELEKLHKSQLNKEFYILQCPRNVNKTMNIPKPKDMHICAVVGKYEDSMLNKLRNNNEKEQPLHYVGSSKSKIRSMLHTKVNFNPKKLRLKDKSQYFGVEKTYKPIDFPLKENTSKEDIDSVSQEDIENETKKFLINFQLFHNIEKKGWMPLKPFQRDQSYAETRGKHLYTNATNWQPLMKSEKKRAEKKFKIGREEKNVTENKGEQFDEENIDENSGPITRIESRSPETPLKYLSVKDVIKKLFKEKQQKYEPKQDNGTAKQFFSENIKYRKGEKKVGLQTMYHRDEIYKDHIFYDDLDQSGQYENRENAAAEN